MCWLRQQISFEVAVVASPILVWAQQFCDSVSLSLFFLWWECYHV